MFECGGGEGGDGDERMGETLALASAAGWARVILVGDEPYYRRFGFRRALATALDYPRPVNPDRVLALELVPGAMTGVTGLVNAWSTAPTAGVRSNNPK